MGWGYRWGCTHQKSSNSNLFSLIYWLIQSVFICTQKNTNLLNKDLVGCPEAMNNIGSNYLLPSFALALGLWILYLNYHSFGESVSKRSFFLT